MDDKTKTGKQDDSEINVNESYELEYWAKKFGVSQDELKDAVKAVGPKVIAVDDYLGAKN